VYVYACVCVCAHIYFNHTRLRFVESLPLCIFDEAKASLISRHWDWREFSEQSCDTQNSHR
jgi:hypothetical protein